MKISELKRGFAEALWKAKCTLASPKNRDSFIRVCHGGFQDWVGGPASKLNRMEAYFPNEPHAFNILYTVNAMYPARICRWARGRGVKVVCHINSMNHRAYAPGFEDLNRPAAEVLTAADHVVFGSLHAKEAAAKFLGWTEAPHTIIYNAVDTEVFRPAKANPDRRFVVLAAGVHTIRHRLEPLIRSMPLVLKTHPEAELLIAGPLRPGQGIHDCAADTIMQIAREVGLEKIRFVGEYTQEEAPAIYAQADVLVHLKHMDWTPNTVIEAMACGLPIVHAGNGGMTETVGSAGVSLGLPNDWDAIHTPDPGFLAENLVRAYQRRHELGTTSRRLAVERYDLRRWAATHQTLFEGLLGRR